MRFFKAINLLHRRTKSETFIPASFIAQSDPALPANSLGPNEFGESRAFASIFDFATSNYTSVPSTFSHLRGVHDTTSARTSVTVGYRRCTGRDSQSSMPSLMVEENMRLRETLDLWFQEYSKVDELLQRCRAELALERTRIQSLQQEAVNDQEVIIKLREDLARYERGPVKSGDKGLSPVNFCGYSSQDRGYESTGSVTDNALLLPAPSESLSSLRIPGQPRTLGDYSSALRLTLNTRRQLRDQKKISKFWKTKALPTGKCEDIITPSTSAISSIHEPLPPGRRAAVEAFMLRRGLPLPQTKVAAQVESAPGPNPSPAPATEELGTVSHNLDTDPNITQILFPASSTSFGSCVIHSSASIAPLPSASSRSSGVSRIHPVASVAQTLASASSSVPRLAPLASESLKAEINLLFGIHDTMGRLSSPSKKRRSGPALSAACSFSTVGPSSSRVSNNLNISFGSYGDLNLLVSVSRQLKCIMILDIV